MRDPIVVLKFGSSVLRSEADLPRTVDEIYRWVRKGNRVAAVVSAIGSATDSLLAKSREYGEPPRPQLIAGLLATGEATSASLLGLALDRAGIPSEVVDAARIGLRTTGPLLDADPCALDDQKIFGIFERCSVLVIPGFIGCNQEDGCTSLLGRGGSDLTALFLAHRLGAERCRLIKDVDGLYERDPAEGGALPLRYRRLCFEDAIQLSGEIVQTKAIQFARAHALRFEVAALTSSDCTLVGTDATDFHLPLHPSKPLKIGLLGLGVVGAGAYQSLTSHPELFEITGVAVRNPERPERAGLRRLLTCDPWSVVNSNADVIVELIGGEEPARSLIAAALRNKKSVVTANKLVIARHGAELIQIAKENGVTLHFSAAVGGAVPMLEIANRLRQTGCLQCLEGVVNGTCNFVLDRLGVGLSFAEAVQRAQALGFAEADPTLDLDGSDTAHKLVLLARAAFDTDLRFDDVERQGILDVDGNSVQRARAAGKVIRLVGRLRDTPEGLHASIGPEIYDIDHPFGTIHDEHNCLIAQTVDGNQQVIHGKGAGRWPTAASVTADLLALASATRTRSRKHKLAISGGIA
jgi:homoserine dehydrogenase